VLTQTPRSTRNEVQIQVRACDRTSFFFKSSLPDANHSLRRWWRDFWRRYADFQDTETQAKGLWRETKNFWGKQVFLNTQFAAQAMYHAID
jgi:hypothetical protein